MMATDVCNLLLFCALFRGHSAPGKDVKMILSSITYYGLTIYYRRENRNDGDRMALSLRDDKAILAEKNLRIPKNLSSSCDNEIANVLTPRFLRLCLSVKNPVLSREEWIPRLPLAVIWAADNADLAHHYKWSKSVITEYTRAMDWLISKYGSKTLAELTPAQIAYEMQTASDRTVASRVRAITALYQYEQYCGVISANPWADYRYRPTRKRKKPEQLVNTHLAQTMFTHEQLYLILKYCSDKLNTVMGAWYAGLITLLTTFISVDELCAQTRNCLCRKDSLPVYYFKLKHVRVKKGKNYTNDTIINPLKLRESPLSSIALRAWLLVLGQDRASNLPLIPRADNAKRFASPADFEKWARGIIRDIIGIDLPPQQLKSMVLNTVERNYRQAGMEEQEIRYLRGMTLTTTGANSYTEFTSDMMCYHLAQVMDQALNRIITTTTPTLEPFTHQIRHNGQELSLADPAGQHCQYRLRVKLTAKQDCIFGYQVRNRQGGLNILTELQNNSREV